jgi:uncharacterized membrane protein (UPF0127 family)
MFKRWFWNLFLFAFIVFGFIILAWSISGAILYSANNPKTVAQEEILSPANFAYNKTMVCFSDNCITTEVADTKEKQQYGLMFRTRIRDTEGMIFVYPEESSRSFYMKNMYISIEIIWLDKNGKINHMEHAFPCTTQNCIIYDYPAKYVLEVKDGFMEDNNLNLGDYVKIDLTKSE